MRFLGSGVAFMVLLFERTLRYLTSYYLVVLFCISSLDFFL